jgi:hypothetical protein
LLNVDTVESGDDDDDVDNDRGDLMTRELDEADIFKC